MKIKQTIHYQYPLNKYAHRVLSEQHIVSDIKAGRGKTYNNRIRLYFCDNACVIKIGKGVLANVYDWLKLRVFIDEKVASKNGLWIEFREVKKNDDCIFIKDKSLHRIALRTYNMIKYFLLCSQKIKEKVNAK